MYRSNGYKLRLIVLLDEFDHSRGWLSRDGELSTSSADANDVNASSSPSCHGSFAFP